jgi:cytochrome b561
MGESFSPLIFLYGMAVVVAVGKACTLFIWRTLPKPRPPLRQEITEAWQRRKTRGPAVSELHRSAATPQQVPPPDEAIPEQLRP